MNIDQETPPRMIEVRGFKWPRRPTSVASAYFLGQDSYGRWLGIAEGDPWRRADGSSSGVFDRSFVKLVPSGTFWTVCFHPVDPLVDIDIVLPVQWSDNVLEEVDLELDIVRNTNGETLVRDREEFNLVREKWSMPEDIAMQAQQVCEEIRALVEQRAEPFNTVGRAWLSSFLGHEGAGAH